MKLNHTLPIIITAVCLAFNGCNKAPDEKTAIATFKTGVESVTNWMDEQKKTSSKDPMAAMVVMSEMVTKMKAIKTDGLPADLKGAWGEMCGVLTELGDVLKGLPTTKPEKPEDAMKAMGEIMPKMMALQTKVMPIAEKLQKVGTKYGLDMSKVGPHK
ncbi:MAG: hypothetical protein ABI318_07590 [Chthoniobacteraceae bacterium]